MKASNVSRALVGTLLLSPWLALAAVGKVSKVEGEATRVASVKETRQPAVGRDVAASEGRGRGRAQRPDHGR